MHIRLRSISLLFSVFFIVYILLPHNSAIGKSIRPFYIQPDVIRVTVIGDYSGKLSYISRSYPENNNHINGYIEAKKGERYSIQISNIDNCRVGVVVSVDGLNIITGEKSYNNRFESMYIIQPGETCDYSGWRSSMNCEQRFYFTDSGDAYASRLGYNSQVGIVKITVFREKNHYYYKSDIYKNERASFRSNMNINPSYSSIISLRKTNPGTGYGEDNYSKAINTDFNPENIPSSIITMKCKWSNSKHRSIPWRLKHHHQGHSFATPPPN